MIKQLMHKPFIICCNYAMCLSDICILYDVTLHCHHLSLRSYKIVRTFSPDNQHTLVLVSTVPAHMNNLKINII